MSQSVLVPVSVGELIDKITILEIKLEMISDPAKRVNISNELKMLQDLRESLGVDRASSAAQVAAAEVALKQVNKKLWDAEDEIRDYDRAKDFGDAFVIVARSIYRLNDERAAHKRDINLASGSLIVEEKGYAPY